MTDEHHTKEQVDKAFAHAPVILRKLKEAGVSYPYFELHVDASGRLLLGDERSRITGEQMALAQELLKSVRPYQMFCSLCFDEGSKEHKGHPHPIGVTFCCGLVQAAEQ